MNGREDGRVVLYAGVAGGSCEGRMVGPCLTPSHIRISIPMAAKISLYYIATCHLCTYFAKMQIGVFEEFIQEEANHSKTD